MGSRRSLAVMVVAVLMTFPVVRLRAALPAIILIYGSPLQRPVTIAGMTVDDYAFLYPMSSWPGGHTLNGRPFLNLAMFWGGDWHPYVQNPSRLKELQPDQANQHGRLYPPTMTEPAVVLTTPGFVCDYGVAGLRGQRTPIPTDLLAFSCGHLLNATNGVALRRLGVPGF